MNSTTTGESSVATEQAPNQWLVIGASSLGTVFEWYDFYIYGLLATILTAQFFSGVNEITGFAIFRARDFRRRVRRAALRGAGVRPARRSGRTQAHVSHHHEHHGRRDVRGRLAAELRFGRPVRADRARSLAPAARARPGRRVRRRRHLCRGARGRRCKRGQYTSWIQTTRHAPDCLRRCSWSSACARRMERGGVQVLGLAHSIPGIVSCCWHGLLVWIRMKLDEESGVYPHEARGAPPRRRRSPRHSGAGAISRSCLIARCWER